MHKGSGRGEVEVEGVVLALASREYGYLLRCVFCIGCMVGRSCLPSCFLDLRQDAEWMAEVVVVVAAAVAAEVGMRLEFWLRESSYLRLSSRTDGEKWLGGVGLGL